MTEELKVADLAAPCCLYNQDCREHYAKTHLQFQYFTKFQRVMCATCVEGVHSIHESLIKQRDHDQQLMADIYSDVPKPKEEDL